MRSHGPPVPDAAGETVRVAERDNQWYGWADNRLHHHPGILGET